MIDGCTNVKGILPSANTHGEVALFIIFKENFKRYHHVIASRCGFSKNKFDSMSKEELLSILNNRHILTKEGYNYYKVVELISVLYYIEQHPYYSGRNNNTVYSTTTH